MRPFPIFVGYDKREAIAYHVACQTIRENTKELVAFIPISGEARDGSNAFIYERFLVPFYCGFQGTALYIDSDIVVRGDVAELIKIARLDQGCQVVKHEYKTKYPVKYLGNKNHDYPRKNWSSVILWNCGFYPNRLLTPEFVDGANGAFLHRFHWLRDEQIGSLPDSWNRLVLEQEVKDDDKLLHYTIGTPCFDEYKDCEGSDEWFDALKRTMEPLC